MGSSGGQAPSSSGEGSQESRRQLRLQRHSEHRHHRWHALHCAPGALHSRACCAHSRRPQQHLGRRGRASGALLHRRLAGGLLGGRGRAGLHPCAAHLAALGLLARAASAGLACLLGLWRSRRHSRHGLCWLLRRGHCWSVWSRVHQPRSQADAARLCSCGRADQAAAAQRLLLQGSALRHRPAVRPSRRAPVTRQLAAAAAENGGTLRIWARQQQRAHAQHSQRTAAAGRTAGGCPAAGRRRRTAVLNYHQVHRHGGVTILCTAGQSWELPPDRRLHHHHRLKSDRRGDVAAGVALAHTCAVTGGPACFCSKRCEAQRAGPQRQPQRRLPIQLQEQAGTPGSGFPTVWPLGLRGGAGRAAVTGHVLQLQVDAAEAMTAGVLQSIPTAHMRAREVDGTDKHLRAGGASADVRGAVQSVPERRRVVGLAWRAAACTPQLQPTRRPASWVAAATRSSTGCGVSRAVSSSAPACAAAPQLV